MNFYMYQWTQKNTRDSLETYISLFKKIVISLYVYLFKTQTFKIQKSKKVSQKPNYYNRYIKMTNITSLQSNVNQNYKEISFMAGILSQKTMSAENMWRKYNA